MNYDEKVCGGNIVSAQQPETLSAIAIQTAEIMTDAEEALITLARVIDTGMLGPCEAKQSRPECFSESIIDLRARSMGLRALANDLLRKFQ